MEAVTSLVLIPLSSPGAVQVVQAKDKISQKDKSQARSTALILSSACARLHEQE